MGILNYFKETSTGTASNNERFTIIEIIMTITLVTVFAGMFLQATIYLSSSINRQGRESRAVGIVSSNLSKYNNSQALPTGFNCSTHRSKSSAFKAITNTSSNREPVPTGNWGSFSQEVLIYARAGCAGPTTVESIVKYGPSDNIREVSQVSYAL